MDSSNIGQDRKYKDSDEAYDAEHGKYKEQVVTGPDKLQESQMPEAPNPSPFKIGPMG